MDDNALQEDCAVRMKGALEQRKGALTHGNMVLKDAKQQVRGMTKQVRDVREPVGGEAASIATHPRLHHDGYGSSLPEMQGKLARVEHAARGLRLVGVTPGEARRDNGVGIPWAMHVRLRKAVSDAAAHAEYEAGHVHRRGGDHHGRRPDGLRLLVLGKGKWEPQVAASIG